MTGLSRLSKAAKVFYLTLNFTSHILNYITISISPLSKITWILCNTGVTCYLLLLLCAQLQHHVPLARLHAKETQCATPFSQCNVGGNNQFCKHVVYLCARTLFGFRDFGRLFVTVTVLVSLLLFLSLLASSPEAAITAGTGLLFLRRKRLGKGEEGPCCISHSRIRQDKHRIIPAFTLSSDLNIEFLGALGY